MALLLCAHSPNTVSLTRSASTKAIWQLAGLSVALITLAGFALRLLLLMRFPLREDEAIYGYWALHAWYVDPLFLHVWPDKPPIFLWLLSAALQLWGHGPATAGAAARWISIMAGTLTIPVLAACARRWWGQSAAVVVALLVALNPFAISFAPTAFTDPLLALAGSLALTLVVRRHWFAGGFWLGIAIMTKQQGLLFVPLVVACALCSARQANARVSTGDKALRPILEYFLHFFAGLGLVVLPILYWDSLRWAVAPSPWDLGASNAGGLTVLPPLASIERMPAWGELLWYLLASPSVWVAYMLALVIAFAAAWRRQAPITTWLPTVILAAWSGGFLLLHVAISVQVWDRYLLPLVIPLLLLGGWAAAELVRTEFPAAAAPARSPRMALRQWLAFTVLTGILLLSTAPAAQAARGGLPIGGDHGAYTGLDEALAAVDSSHTLLFHRELGWQARFALFDAIRNGNVELRYFPSTVYLADSATKSPHKQRFVIVPAWAPLPDLQMQLAVRRLHARLILRAGHFTVYRIEVLPTPDTSWRVCSMTPFPVAPLQ
jgi:4-amino-4-deoxy-L-arabinose transferase-like glycosyltransferase